MAGATPQRRLAAILAADVVGYSRLVSADEDGTLKAFQSHLAELIEPKLSEFNGRLFKTMGDGLLAEFASVVEAVQCAVAIQQGMAERNAEANEDRKLEFRIGINLGDVVVEDDDVFGDGVNVAARLEGLAEPGGICISRSARDQIRDKLDYGLEDWGEVEVKNIPRPVRVFRVLPDPQDAGKIIAKSADPKLKFKPLVVAILLLSLAVAGGALWWQPWASDVEAASVDKMAFPLPALPSIAVLPFTNLSNDEDQEFFADGITDDIITDLSKISGIFVVARHSTLGYKGKDIKIRQIAEELGVRYVLGGSIRRAGNKLRITAQLIDAIKGDHLWSNRYDREVKDVFAVQSDVTKRVVKAMAVTLKAREHDRVFQKYVTNIAAYDVWQQARAIVEVPSRDNISKGEALFKKTIELDPKFAGGYAGLAFNYGVKARFGFSAPGQDDAGRALTLARKAIEVDPDFAWSHIALAGAHLANGDHDAAVDAAQKALAIQPGGFEANLFMAFYLYFAGKESALAVKHAEIADSMSRVPTYRGLVFLGMSYLLDRQYAKSEATWLRIIKTIGPVKQNSFHVLFAASQAALNKNEKAAATVANFLRIHPDFRLSKWHLLKTLKSEEFRQRLVKLAVKAGIPE